MMFLNIIYESHRSFGVPQDDSKSCEKHTSPKWRCVPLTPSWTQCVFPSAGEGPINHIIFDKPELFTLRFKNRNNSTSTFIIRYSIFIILFLLNIFTQAQPLLSSAKQIHGINIYQDANNSRYFYYEPGELIIAKNASQKPDFTLLMMRYTGNAATGDKGEIRHRNILRLGIQMIPPNKDSLTAIKAVLKSQNRRAILKPIPIHQLESVLIYNLVGEEKFQVFPTGEYDADREKGLTGRSLFWAERDYAISLDNHSAEIFDQALKKGQVVLSIGYAFITKGFAHDPNQKHIIGSPDWLRKWKPVFKCSRIAFPMIR